MSNVSGTINPQNENIFTGTISHQEPYVFVLFYNYQGEKTNVTVVQSVRAIIT